MKRTSSWDLRQYARGIFALIALLAISCILQDVFELEQAGAASSELQDIIPNNHPERNSGGKAATFSTQGAVDLTGEYFQAQGTNGRSCASCHISEDAWSINPGTLQHLFDETNGSHPVFNELDANNPDELTPQYRLDDLICSTPG